MDAGSMDADVETQDSLDDAEALAIQQDGDTFDDMEEMQMLQQVQKQHEGGQVLQVFLFLFCHRLSTTNQHRNLEALMRMQLCVDSP